MCHILDIFIVSRLCQTSDKVFSHFFVTITSQIDVSTWRNMRSHPNIKANPSSSLFWSILSESEPFPFETEMKNIYDRTLYEKNKKILIMFNIIFFLYWNNKKKLQFKAEKVENFFIWFSSIFLLLQTNDSKCTGQMIFFSAVENLLHVLHLKVLWNRSDFKSPPTQKNELKPPRPHKNHFIH